MGCVFSTDFFVLNNGSTSSLFKAPRGQPHQGFPLSPYLFLLIVEWYHILLYGGYGSPEVTTFSRIKQLLLFKSLLGQWHFFHISRSLLRKEGRQGQLRQRWIKQYLGYIVMKPTKEMDRTMVWVMFSSLESHISTQRKQVQVEEQIILVSLELFYSY